MNKDLLVTMKRILAVAHYALDKEVVPHSEVAQTLAFIIENANEAINNAKEQDQ
jgi:hypothetical protein